jgi:hypothetical protein
MGTLMTYFKKVLPVLVCCCLTLQGAGTMPVSLGSAEERLKNLFAASAAATDDSQKLMITDSMVALLEQTLGLPGAFDYPFDSLKSLGKITASDGRVRIFTWNLPMRDATNLYFGFIQYRTNARSLPKIYKLTDASNEITDPAGAVLPVDQWYGMLVYDIIVRNLNETSYYTLLGYDPENLFVSRKLVDVLYFDPAGQPMFGKPIFHYKNKMQCRLLFEYSARVQMSLRWNESKKMIVFDHLSPPKSSLTGNYQYYGPDFSYDALRFDNGIWELVEDVDVRNSNE